MSYTGFQRGPMLVNIHTSSYQGPSPTFGLAIPIVLSWFLDN